ncbi:MAG: hypothetical protein U9N60_04480 [Thermodesulfobacteriota bacterium]|nr:hypothetical protein [Thermodesulfobacteriota bacterium]
MESKQRKQKAVKQAIVVVLITLLTGTFIIRHAEVKIDKEIISEVSSEDLKEKVQTQTCEVISETVRYVTAYNVNDPDQCFGDPCISANGENICNALDLGYNRCAANFVPLGTILFVENYGECLVTDRMNSRYKNRVDIAMKKDEKEKALTFGIQKINVKILTKM